MNLTQPETSVACLIDDDVTSQNWVASMLENAGIATQIFSSGLAFLEAWDGSRAGCLVIDYKMPEMSGLELVREIRHRGLATPFVVLTGYGTVPMAVEAMKLGAISVFEKPIRRNTLLDAISWAMKLDLSEREKLRKQARLLEKLNSLSPREREILDEVMSGMLSKNIAHKLGISIRTVEVHRFNLTKKLGFGSIAELIQVISATDCKHRGGMDLIE